jgi:hypothetical protein
VIGEWVGARRFQPWAFTIGLRVVHETRSLPRPPQPVGSEFQTTTACFKMISPQLCLFYYPGVSVFYLPRKRYAPIIKGTIEWNDGQADDTRQDFLRSRSFFAAFFAFAFIPSPSVPADVKNRLLVGLALMAGLFLLFVWHFVRGARRISSEFEAEMA